MGTPWLRVAAAQDLAWQCPLKTLELFVLQPPNQLCPDADRGAWSCVYTARYERLDRYAALVPPYFVLKRRRQPETSVRVRAQM